MAQGRAHFGREEAIDRFMHPGRVSPFEHGKPIIGGHEGIDRPQVAQSVANFAKMDVITSLQLYILEGHNGVQSPSLIFIRVTDAVEPFDFEFVLGHGLPFLLNGRRDGLRQQPDLFGKLGNGQADEF